MKKKIKIYLKKLITIKNKVKKYLKRLIPIIKEFKRYLKEVCKKIRKAMQNSNIQVRSAHLNIALVVIMYTLIFASLYYLTHMSATRVCYVERRENNPYAERIKLLKDYSSNVPIAFADNNTPVYKLKKELLRILKEKYISVEDKGEIDIIAMYTEIDPKDVFKSLDLVYTLKGGLEKFIKFDLSKDILIACKGGFFLYHDEKLLFLRTNIEDQYKLIPMIALENANPFRSVQYTKRTHHLGG